MRGAINDVGVIAVDENWFEPVGRSSIRRRMLDRGDFADWRILHVEIVLAHEDDRQFPDRCEVQRFVEGTDIGGAVAEETYRDIVLALVLGAQRRPARD